MAIGIYLKRKGNVHIICLTVIILALLPYQNFNLIPLKSIKFTQNYHMNQLQGICCKCRRYFAVYFLNVKDCIALASKTADLFDFCATWTDFYRLRVWYRCSLPIYSGTVLFEILLLVSWKGKWNKTISLYYFNPTQHFQNWKFSNYVLIIQFRSHIQLWRLRNSFSIFCYSCRIKGV